jgi:hypothetical protein
MNQATTKNELRVPDESGDYRKMNCVCLMNQATTKNELRVPDESGDYKK